MCHIKIVHNKETNLNNHAQVNAVIMRKGMVGQIPKTSFRIIREGDKNSIHKWDMTCECNLRGQIEEHEKTKEMDVLDVTRSKGK